MMHTPCEYIVWHGLPFIRKEISKSMINKYGLNESETAKKLGITTAAVSQYLSGKRGNMTVDDAEIFNEINRSAGRIIKSGNKILVFETCRLCKMLISKKILPFKKYD